MTTDVVAEAEDVLLEILVRLPLKSVCKFKCVSRRWNEIMSGSFFCGRYARRHIKHSSGLVALILSEKRYNRSLPRTRVADINSTNEATNDVPKECGRFICSSNGLALFVYEPSNHPINWGPGRKSKPPPTYHVVNILTKAWAPLPLSPTKNKECESTALVCTATNHFEVVRVLFTAQPYGLVSVEIYSSNTGRWIKYMARMHYVAGHFCYRRYNNNNGILMFIDSVYFSGPFGLPVVLNGIIHWSVSNDAIATYEPKRINKQGDRENDWVLIEKPVVDETLCSYAFTRPTASRRARVWYGGITWQRQIKIWNTKLEIEWGTSPWSLVHTLNFDDSLLSSDHSILTSYQRECIKDYNDFHIIGLSPWNPRILLFLVRGAIFLYNTDNGLMERLNYGGPRIIDPIGIQPCFFFSDF